MRLTDVPRALAAVRPDVQWPLAVQATLDLALARDAKDRYQSAAQFGREFAAALAQMPAHATDAAGTVVMSAPATVASPTRPAVPPTRVGAHSEATVTEPPPKNKTPLALGGVGAAVAIAIVAWKMGVIGGGSAPSGETAAAGANPSPNAVVMEGSAAAPPTLPASNGTPQLMSNPQRGSGAEPSAAGARVATPAPTPAATPSTPPQSTSQPSTPTASGMSQIQGWLREVQSPSVSASTARRVVGDIQQLRSTLSGLPLAESYYVEVIAYTVLENERGFCQAARRVRELHSERSRLSFANNVLTNFCEEP